MDFWNDNQVRVVQSHTVSLMYLLKMKEIKAYLRHNQIIYSGSESEEAQRRYDLWYQTYQKRGVQK